MSESTQPASLRDILPALIYAAQVHKGQRRKDRVSSPHINHVLRVVNKLVNAGLDDVTTLQAAVLHDTLRSGAGRAELLDEFGPEVLAIVEEVSGNLDLPRQERRQELIDSSTRLTDSAAAIRMAEKITNLNQLIEDPPAGWSRQRRRDYFDLARTVTEPLRGRSEYLDGLLDEALSRAP